MPEPCRGKLCDSRDSLGLPPTLRQGWSSQNPAGGAQLGRGEVRGMKCHGTPCPVLT